MKNFAFWFRRLPLKLIGIGITAFNRVGPASFLPDYEIICYKNSTDVKEIGRKCSVKVVERDFKGDLKRLNSLAILKHQGVQAYLKQKKTKIGLFLYKSTPKIEKLADHFGWEIITNRSNIRDPYENKKIFREILAKIGIEPVPGQVLALAKFNESVLARFQKEYGPKLVLQLPEVTKGGGRGNTFINKKEDLTLFWAKLKKLSQDFDLKNVIVAKFIEGLSPSITGCATRHGILTGVVQTQITDIPEVINLDKGAGLFCGHDWSYRYYSAKVQKQAERIGQCFGNYLYQRGYKGIFGIDLLVEKGTDRVYPVECNPRYTGAFPVYSMIQWAQNEPSFDVFQLLEHLGIDYEMDFLKINTLYKQPKKGSQLILYNQTKDYLQVGGGIRAGVWQLVDGELRFIRPGFGYQDMKKEEEFVFTDGVPNEGMVIRPDLRIMKLIFPHKILTKDGREIDTRTKLIVKKIYRRLKLDKTRLT